MSAAELKELVDHQAIVMPLDVSQYHGMVEAGILPEGEPYELLGGYLVRKDRSAFGEDPMTVGNHHAWAITCLAKLNPKLAKLGCHIRTQLPIVAGSQDEPEPDGAIVTGDEDDFRERHPEPEDVTCVIEVADSSLQRDRVTKQRIHANAGIAQYVIVNLRDRAIEIYTQPLSGKDRYGHVVTSNSGAIELPAGTGKKISVQVRTLLP